MKDWQWVMDVNLMGVVEGARLTVPEIIAAGGGWVINVGSMAGMGGVPFAGAYTASKLAVVGLAEAWSVELAPHNIHVAALCPAFVQTRIHLSERNKPEALLEQGERKLTEDAIATMDPATNPMSAVIAAGIEPDLLGARVVEALEAGELYILTHPKLPTSRTKKNGSHRRRLRSCGGKPHCWARRQKSNRCLYDHRLTLTSSGFLS